MATLLAHFWVFYNTLLTGWWGRFIRVAIAAQISHAVVVWQANPQYAWLLPILVAASKALRDKFPGKFEWLPL